MDIDQAVNAFRAMIQAAEEDSAPTEIRLSARPVIDAHHPGDTVPIVDNELPAGTEPSEPDALALELHVTRPQGQPVGGRILDIAREHGLSVGTSDLLLL